MCVFVGRYCRSACSCRVSGKEHEPAGNAQKHQHWRHQHQSAKFTFLQVAAARSWSCSQPMFTAMQSAYQNLKLLTCINYTASGPVWHSLFWCYSSFLFFSFFPVEQTKKVSCFLFVPSLGRKNEVFIYLWYIPYASVEVDVKLLQNRSVTVCN